MVDNDLTIFLKDKLTQDDLFVITCENIDDFENLLQEVNNYCDRLNELDTKCSYLEKENKSLKKLNNMLEGFLLDKGYTFDDIIIFLHNRISVEDD